LAQTPANYANSNKKALTTTACWSDYTSSDPGADIETARNAIRAQIGKFPNLMVIGPATYTILKYHPKVTDRIKFVQKSIINTDILAELFDIPRVVIGNAVMSSDKNVNSDVWGDNAILAYVPDKPGRYEPAAMYTYRMNGYPQGDNYFGIGEKVEHIRATDMSTPFIVGKDAMYLISNTVA
ncbi:hypothetical protein MBAV_003267, partial [Candidatus Magnetobacterium bavaricum]